MARQRIKLRLADFGLDARSRLGRMQAIAEMVLAEWQAAARASGKMHNRTLPSYLRALAVREVTADRCVVELAGSALRATDGGDKVATMAMMMEFGMGPGGIGTEGPYDIRTMVLKAGTRNLRMGKSGWYVNIPFDHTPASILERGGKEALKLAQDLRYRIVDAAGKASWDTRTWNGCHGVLVNTAQRARRLPAGRAPIGFNKILGPEKGRHATDLLAGMVRLGSTYSRGPDSLPRIQTTGYRTWRRMSAAGKPWMHPGIQALRLGERVAGYVPGIVARAGF